MPGIRWSTDEEFLRGLNESIEEGIIAPSPLERYPEPAVFGYSTYGDEVVRNTRAAVPILEGLLKSTFDAGTRELVGLEPSPTAQQFRAEHPVAGIATQLLGYGIPFAATTALFPPSSLARLPGAVGAAGRFATSAQGLVTNPIATRAARYGLETALFEGSRFATATGLRLAGGEEYGDPLEVAREAAFNVPLGAAFGAGVGALRSLSPLPRTRITGEEAIRQRFEAYNLNDPPQLRLRKIREIRATTPEEEIDDVLNGILARTDSALSRQVLTQVPQAGITAPVKRLEFGGEAKDVGSLFRLGKILRGNARSRLLTSGSKGFKTQEDLDEFLSRAMDQGVPKNLDELAVLPRAVEALTPESSYNIRRKLGKMTKVAKNTWLAKEEGGLYVVGVKVKGRVIEGKAGDQFLFLKTDRPGVFAPKATKFAEIADASMFRVARENVETAIERQIPMARDFNKTLRALPIADFPADTPRGKLADKIVRALIPDELFREDLGKGRKFLSNQIREFFSPVIRQFSDYPPAVRVASLARVAFSAAERRAIQLFGGQRILTHHEKLGPVFSQIFGRPEFRGGIRKAIQALDDVDIKDLHEAFIDKLTVAAAKERGYSNKVLTLMRRLDRVSTQLSKEMQAINNLTGTEGAIVPLRDQLMQARTWRGTFRVPIKYLRGTQSKIVGYGTGKTRAEAALQAEKLVKLTKEIDPEAKVYFDPAEYFTSRRDQDIGLAGKIITGTREFGAFTRAYKKLVFPPRAGLLGERFAEATSLLTRNELEDILFGQVLESNRYIAAKLFYHKMAGEISNIRANRPDLANQLIDRISKMGGEQGELNKALSRAVDKVLSPWMGGNAASKIVEAANKVAFTLTLGAGDLGFPALNAVTFIQTVLPEVSFLLTAPPRALARHYTPALVATRGGLRTVHQLEPMRIAWTALKKMAKPDAEDVEWFSRATKEGLTDPRFVEEFMGALANQAAKLREVLSGKQGFLSYLNAIQKYMPAKSEEFARTHAFFVGKTITKDFFPSLSDEAAYQMTREFVENTMYLYSQSARPQVLTGPVGGFFGLFKNWMFHYIANMAGYAGQALKGNPAPFFWMMGGTGALGGVAALPGYFAVDGFSRLASDKGLMENLYEMFGYGTDDEWVGEVGGKAVDGLYYGLPAFLGLALQSRAEAPGADIVRDVNQLFNTVMLERANFLGKAVGALVDDWALSGRHPMNQSQTAGLFARALLPRTLYRWAQLVGNKGVRSLQTGNELISQTTLGEEAAFILGMTPLDFQKSQDVSNELFSRQEKMREMVLTYGSILADAIERQDKNAIQDVYRQVYVNNVPIGSVARSAHERIINRTFPTTEREFGRGEGRKLEKKLGLR